MKPQWPTSLLLGKDAQLVLLCASAALHLANTFGYFEFSGW